MEIHEKKNIAVTVSLVIALLAIVFFGGKHTGERSALQEIADTAVLAPVVEPSEIPPVIIEVDGIGCVIAEEPVLTYYSATDTVRISIECDGDIMDYYRPALVPDDQQ